MQEVTGYGDNASKEIDDELLQNMQQLISAACASRGRWGGWNRRNKQKNFKEVEP